MWFPESSPASTLAVEIFAGINFLVIGLSHVLRPKAWVEFFQLLHIRGNAGAFANSFLALWFGSIIIAFHNVWDGLPIILTIIGWAQILKAAIGFTIPELTLRGMGHVAPERAWEFHVGGAFALVVAGFCFYLALSRGIA